MNYAWLYIATQNPSKNIFIFYTFGTVLFLLDVLL